MSDAADIAVRTQRFNEAARTFTPPSPSRHAKLMPLKEGIVELRQKGASLRLIRELLLTVDVAVSADTIARFLVEVSDAPVRRRELPRRSDRRAIAAAVKQLPTAVVEPAPQPAKPPAAPPNDTPPERPRTRGPRIADPRNL